MATTEGTYIQVAYKNVFGYISTNSWPFFMIQRPTIREKCVWVRSNTWLDERPVATGLDRFFRFFDKHCNWQPKKFRICANATGGPVFCSWVQSDFGLFSSPANWTCEHYCWSALSSSDQRQNCWSVLISSGYFFLISTDQCQHCWSALSSSDQKKMPLTALYKIVSVRIAD